MSSLRPLLLTLVLAGAPGAGDMVSAKQQFDDPAGPARKGAPSLTHPMFSTEFVATTQAEQLPGGASSISETYGDWAVNCKLTDRQKQCWLFQKQGNSQAGEPVFAIGLRMTLDENTVGTILAPFGLKLDSGAILKLDEKDLSPALRFSTCVPQGCLLPVSFPAAAIDAMKKAKVLTVASLSLDGGEAANFNISLEGFAVAFDRLVELGK